MERIAREMTDLRKQLNELLKNLKRGFNTPTGKRFFESCDLNVLQAIDDQVLVMNHVADNLRSARSSYQTVFSEYVALNNKIKNGY